MADISIVIQDEFPLLDNVYKLKMIVDNFHFIKRDFVNYQHIYTNEGSSALLLNNIRDRMLPPTFQDIPYHTEPQRYLKGIPQYSIPSSWYRRGKGNMRSLSKRRYYRKSPTAPPDFNDYEVIVKQANTAIERILGASLDYFNHAVINNYNMFVDTPLDQRWVVLQGTDSYQYPYIFLSIFDVASRSYTDLDTINLNFPSINNLRDIEMIYQNEVIGNTASLAYAMFQEIVYRVGKKNSSSTRVFSHTIDLALEKFGGLIRIVVAPNSDIMTLDPHSNNNKPISDGSTERTLSLGDYITSLTEWILLLNAVAKVDLMALVSSYSIGGPHWLMTLLTPGLFKITFLTLTEAARNKVAIINFWDIINKYDNISPALYDKMDFKYGGDVLKNLLGKHTKKCITMSMSNLDAFSTFNYITWNATIAADAIAEMCRRKISITAPFDPYHTFSIVQPNFSFFSGTHTNLVRERGFVDTIDDKMHFIVRRTGRINHSSLVRRKFNYDPLSWTHSAIFELPAIPMTMSTADFSIQGFYCQLSLEIVDRLLGFHPSSSHLRLLKLLVEMRYEVLGQTGNVAPNSQTYVPMIIYSSNNSIVRENFIQLITTSEREIHFIFLISDSTRPNDLVLESVMIEPPLHWLAIPLTSIEAYFDNIIPSDLNSFMTAIDLLKKITLTVHDLKNARIILLTVRRRTWNENGQRWDIVNLTSFDVDDLISTYLFKNRKIHIQYFQPSNII